MLVFAGNLGIPVCRLRASADQMLLQLFMLVLSDIVVLTNIGDFSSGFSGTRGPCLHSRYPDDDIIQPLTLHYIASTNKSYPSRNAPLLQHLKPVLIKYVQESNVHRLWYVYLTSTLSLA